MKRPSLLLAACVALVACSSDEISSYTHAVAPPQLPPPTFVVFGTVRDSGGAPIAGATAVLLAGEAMVRTATSNAAGHFSFTGVAGTVTVRVFKEGFDLYASTITVSADVVIEVRLGRVDLSDSIRLGQTIRSTVQPDAPPCDPIRWDARAPCRKFTFQPLTNGLLVITISWHSGPELDATIVRQNGEYVATSVDGPGGEISLAAGVDAGQTYDIRVNSYYSGQDFLLRAEFKEAAAPRIFGTVRDTEGAFLPGASVEIVAGPHAGRTAISNVWGHFSFTGVSGMLTIRAFKSGYERYETPLTVSGDAAIELTLARLERADTMRFGQTIQSTVESDSPPCDPVGWDAKAPCRRFHFRPPKNGLFVVTISWNGGPEMDATMVLDNGQYVATSADAPGDEVTLAAGLEAGKLYVLRVNSYYSRQDFLLRAEFKEAEGARAR